MTLFTSHLGDSVISMKQLDFELRNSFVFSLLGIVNIL
jgi:hypothetical protein